MSTRLIIVRAGSQSLHTGWGEGDWDLLNAYYDDSPPPEAVPIQGGKWDGIYQLFQQQPDLLERYQTIWLPDDDIETQASDIEKLFELHEHYQLELSQPSLTYDSFVLHIALLQNPRFKLRYSNFVEIMMPCFSVHLLRKLLPLFENNRTGQFLDLIWHRFCDQPYRGAALIDEVKMRHSRPVGRSGDSSLDQSNRFTEGRTHLAQFLPHTPKKLPRPIFYAGITKNNKIIQSTSYMGWLLFLAWLPCLRWIAQKAHIGTGTKKRGVLFLFSRYFRQILLHHLLHCANLTRLELK